MKRSGHRRPQNDRQTRVGFVSLCLYHGGAERWIYSLSKWWPPHMRTSGILVRRGAVTSRSEAARYGPVWEWDANNIPEACQALTEASDIVLAWGEHDLAMLAPYIRRPIVAVSHGASHYDFSRNVATAMETHAVAHAAVCREAAAAYSAHIAAKATVIHNGAEADRCVPIVGGAALRARYGIPAWAPVALYAGRISAEKHCGTARAMLDHLPSTWHLIMAGGNTASIPAHPRMHSTGVYWHPGDLLDAATVFVCPSESEAHCLALNEAWLAGVPAVTTYWPVLDELTQGTVIPITLPHPSPPEAWAAAVEHAATSDPEPFRRLALGRYTAPAMANRWASYLSGLV